LTAAAKAVYLRFIGARPTAQTPVDGRPPRGSAGPPSSSRSRAIADSSTRGSAGNNAARPASAPYLPPLVSDGGSTAFLIIISAPNEWDSGRLVRRTAPVFALSRPCDRRSSFLDNVDEMKRDDLIMIRSSVLLSFVRSCIYFTCEWSRTIHSPAANVLFESPRSSLSLAYKLNRINLIF